MLARAVPEIVLRINLLIFQGKPLDSPSRQKKKGYGASYNQTGAYREWALSWGLDEL
jgi:hypothetical protein